VATPLAGAGPQVRYSPALVAKLSPRSDLPAEPRNPAPKAEPHADGLPLRFALNGLLPALLTNPAHRRIYRAIGALAGPRRPAPGWALALTNSPSPLVLRPADEEGQSETNWPPPGFNTLYPE